MARNIRWRVPFKSISNKQYYINIYDEGWTGSITTLTGSASPIVINEDKDEDIFKPVRTSSGNISLIGGSELQALIPQYATHRYVVLVDGSNNVHWHGYIKPETFSMDWKNEPTEVQLPVISPIGVLEGVELTASSAITSSFLDILEEAMNATKAHFTGLVMPQLLTDFTPLLDYSFIRDLWVKDNTAEDDGSGDYKAKVGDYIKNVLEDVCRFWGLQLREWQGQLFFVASGYTGYYKRADDQDIYDWLEQGEDLRWTNYNENLNDFTDFEWMSNKNKESVIQGKKKIVINGDFSALNEILKTPSFDKLKHLDKDYYGLTCQRLVYPGKGILIRQFAPQSSATDMACVYDNKAGINDVSKCDSGYPWNLSIIHYGAFSQGEMLGACLIKECNWDSDNEPHHLSFTDRIYIKGRGDNNYACRIVGKSQIIQKGCLNLKAKIIHRTTNDAGTTIANAAGSIKVQIKLGDMYYTGNSYNADTKRWSYGTWQSTPCTFLVHYDGGSILDTNNIRSDYDDADGFIMPLTSTMGGELYISIYGDQTNQYTGTYHIGISDMELKYCPLSHDVVEISDRTQNTYAKILNKGFTEEYQVDNKIATYIDGNKNGVGFLINKAGRAAQRITYDDRSAEGIEKIPEQEVLGRIASWYNHTIHQISIDLKYDSSYRPIDILQDSKDYRNLAFSFDYANDIMSAIVQSNE